MKNKIIILTAFLLAFSLAGCSGSGNTSESSQNDSMPETSVSENIPDDNSGSSDDDLFYIPPVIEVNEDYFGKLDGISQKQISLIADKLPELSGEHQYIYITDLDSNGRPELILCEPDFIMYEVSENNDALIKTAALADDFPLLYPVTDRLMYIDFNGTKHYIWRSVRDESETSVRESDKDYVYENGQLSVRNLRSRVYERYEGVYKSYHNAEGEPDIPGYSKAIAELCFYSGYTLMQNSMGVLTHDDISSADSETMKQLLAELRGYFAVTAPTEKFQYTDLSGTWIRKGGFSSGSNYFHQTEGSTVKLTFHDDVYEISGTDALIGSPAPPAPVSFCIGGTISTSLWYASLSDNGTLKNAVVKLNSDGTLLLEGLISGQDGQNINTEWIFHKEGWEYKSDEQPLVQNTQPYSEAQSGHTVPSGQINQPPQPSAPVFSAETLAEKSLAYYEMKNSYRPEKASVSATDKEGIFSVHLYDEYEDYTTTYTWYTIDSATMTGTDDVTGEPVDLNIT